MRACGRRFLAALGLGCAMVGAVALWAFAAAWICFVFFWFFWRIAHGMKG